MNIFKIGLVLSVLLFNLSCAVFPKSQSECPLVNHENQEEPDDQLEIDGNVAEASFIEFDSKPHTDIDQLISYLDQYEIHDEASIKNLDQLLSEVNFSSDQLKNIETEIETYASSLTKKEFLQSLVIKLQSDVNQ